MKHTADTVTDEEIRELRGSACDAGDVQTWRICDIALGGPPDDVAINCPLCSEASGLPCRSVRRRPFRGSINTRPRIVRTHAQRLLTRRKAIERVAEILNARASQAK